MVYQDILLLFGNISYKCMTSVKQAFWKDKTKSKAYFFFKISNGNCSWSFTVHGFAHQKRGRCNMEKETSKVSTDSPSNSRSSLQSKKYRFQPYPPNSLRYYKQEHWVVFGEKGRCRFCNVAHKQLFVSPTPRGVEMLKCFLNNIKKF